MATSEMDIRPIVIPNELIFHDSKQSEWVNDANANFFAGLTSNDLWLDLKTYGSDLEMKKFLRS